MRSGCDPALAARNRAYAVRDASSAARARAVRTTRSASSVRTVRSRITTRPSQTVWRTSDPRAAYAVVDLDDLSVTQHRVSYDIDAVEDAVSEAGLPEKIGKRLHLGK